jgi:sugar/nucleoside kinase (ribokinase family)
MPRPFYDVLIVGDYSLDLIFTGQPHMPELGKDTLASSFSMLPGEAYTSAIAMHRLGLKVGWAGDFGDDDFSRFTIQQAEQEGLDASLFVHHKRPYRRISVVASFPTDRGFLTFYDPDPKVPAAIKALAKTAARVLFIPGFYCGPFFDIGLSLARARRMKVVMDGNAGGGGNLQALASNPAVRKAVQSVDVLLPNADEARLLSGQDDLMQALHILGELCPLVVVKDGRRGSYAAEGGADPLHVPALSLEAVDTTGAGDCFNAGFLKAWLDDKPLVECLRWGNIVGGLSTLAPGGTGRVITASEVRKWLQTKG